MITAMITQALGLNRSQSRGRPHPKSRSQVRTRSQNRPRIRSADKRKGTVQDSRETTASILAASKERLDRDAERGNGPPIPTTQRTKPPRKQSRSEILALVAAMAEELDRRAAESAAAYGRTRTLDAAACQRAARHLREVLGIANGQRSAAYWQYRTTQRS